MKKLLGCFIFLFLEASSDNAHSQDSSKYTAEELNQKILQEPENNNYLFDLALVYQKSQNYREAIKWFKKYIEREKSNTQKSRAKNLIGNCYESNNDWAQALNSYLEAYELNPGSSRAFYQIAKHYRLCGNNSLAYLFASHGKKNLTADCDVESDRFIYDYGFDEELSIAAFYTPYRQEGFNASDRIILNKKAEPRAKDMAYRNILFYVKNLPNTEFKKISIDLPRINEKETYMPLNPSIIKTATGYMIICRTVNFFERYWKIRDGSKIVKTRNFLVYYDKDFKFLKQSEIVEKTYRKKFECGIQGFEDCRIFEWGSNYWFTCTVCDSNEQAVRRMGLCQIPDELVDSTINVEKVIVFNGPEESRWEKNWMHFIVNNNLFFIYSYDPFVIYKLNNQTGQCELERKIESKYDFSQFRGSAAPIEFDDGYLMIVHERIVKNRCWYYVHRFLYLNRNFEITKLSKPFTFKHKGIEFCCSMTVDHSGNKLIISVGIDDKEASLCLIDVADVRVLLEPMVM